MLHLTLKYQTGTKLFAWLKHDSLLQQKDLMRQKDFTQLGPMF